MHGSGSHKTYQSDKVLVHYFVFIIKWKRLHRFFSLVGHCCSLQARSLLKKSGEEVPIELLNNIGVLQFERAEFKVGLFD